MKGNLELLLTSFHPQAKGGGSNLIPSPKRHLGLAPPISPSPITNLPSPPAGEKDQVCHENKTALIYRRRPYPFEELRSADQVVGGRGVRYRVRWYLSNR